MTGYIQYVFICVDGLTQSLRQKIIEKLGRGVTGLQGRGMYTNQDKTILICVISPREIARIKDVVLEADSRAFVIVNDSREVLGEGFVEI